MIESPVLFVPHRAVLRVLRDLSEDSLSMKERLLGRNCDIASSPQWLSSVSRIKLFTRMGGPHLTVPNSDTTNELIFSINLITFGFFTAPRHPITNRANWPTESELNLNEKQREALIEASTLYEVPFQNIWATRNREVKGGRRNNQTAHKLLARFDWACAL